MNASDHIFPVDGSTAVSQEKESLKSPRISLGMIVKDEEAVLARCLESVAGLVDEMVIVDTGSSDRTVEIAESFGARIIRHQWKGDFAEARNVYLEAASGDWVLVLDADEELDPKAKSIVRNCASLRKLGGKLCLYFLQERSYTGEEAMEAASCAVEHYIPRLIPRDPEIFYSGVIHENVFHRRGPDHISSIAVKDGLIHHYGYSGEEQRRKNRAERNEPLLKKAVETESDNPFAHYNYALFLFDVGKRKEALEEFRACQQLIPGGFVPPYFPSSHIFCGMIMLGEERIIDALRELKEALRLSPGLPDAHYGIGRIYLMLGEREMAINHFEEALRTREGIPTYFGISDLGSATWKPCLELAAIHAESGDWERALEYFVKARGYAPDIKLILADIGLCFCRLGKYREAVQAWDEAYPVGFGQSPLMLEYADALSRIGRGEDAAHRLRDWRSSHDDAPEVLLKEARLLGQLKKSDEALEIYLALLESHPHDLALCQEAAEQLIVAGRYEDAVALIDKGLSAVKGSS